MDDPRQNEMLGREWLILTGNGAYATSTFATANTRKQHGLFITPTQGNFKRYLYLSRLEDRIDTAEEKLELSSALYRESLSLRAQEKLRRCRIGPFPTWDYESAKLKVKKTIVPIEGEESIALRYRITSPKKGVLSVRPILGLRYIHELSQVKDIPLGIREGKSGLFLRPGEHTVPPFAILAPFGQFTKDFHWYEDFYYLKDRLKGEGYLEDLPSPGFFTFPIEEGKSVFHIIFSTEEKMDSLVDEEPEALLRRSLKRRLKKGAESPHRLAEGLFKKSFRPIEDAALSLVTSRNGDTLALAGYPYLGLNIYDLLIYLTYYLIGSANIHLASSVIDFLIPSLRKGMLPKYFDEEGVPIYCAADISLLFVEAIARFLRLTGSRAERKRLYPVISEITGYYMDGGADGVRMSERGLLEAGQEGLEATWMDRVVGDTHLTGRYGEAVDVNALWYNALCIEREISLYMGKKGHARELTRIIARVKHAFLAQFVLQTRGYLADFVREGTVDDTLRPNQIYSLSVTNPVLSKTLGKRILHNIKSGLVTDLGLRTSSPESNNYVGSVDSGERERLHSLFNGAVHPHLALPYAEAMIRVYGPTPRVIKRIRRFLISLRRAAEKSSPYYLPEAFDGDSPHNPAGSPVSLASTGTLAALYRLYSSMIT